MKYYVSLSIFYLAGDRGSVGQHIQPLLHRKVNNKVWQTAVVHALMYIQGIHKRSWDAGIVQHIQGGATYFNFMLNWIE
eukprot:1154470-Pelagomonas_calceolata.AAC.8